MQQLAINLNLRKKTDRAARRFKDSLIKITGFHETVDRLKNLSANLLLI